MVLSVSFPEESDSLKPYKSLPITPNLTLSMPLESKTCISSLLSICIEPLLVFRLKPSQVRENWEWFLILLIISLV